MSLCYVGGANSSPNSLAGFNKIFFDPRKERGKRRKGGQRK